MVVTLSSCILSIPKLIETLNCVWFVLNVNPPTRADNFNKSISSQLSSVFSVSFAVLCWQKWKGDQKCACSRSDVSPLGCPHWLAHLGPTAVQSSVNRVHSLIRFFSWTCKYHLDSVALTLLQSIFERKAPFDVRCAVSKPAPLPVWAVFVSG